MQVLRTLDFCKKYLYLLSNKILIKRQVSKALCRFDSVRKLFANDNHVSVYLRRRLSKINIFLVQFSFNRHKTITRALKIHFYVFLLNQLLDYQGKHVNRTLEEQVATSSRKITFSNQFRRVSSTIPISANAGSTNFTLK